MGGTSRGSVSGAQGSSSGQWGRCDAGPRNTDGTWVAGVAKGPYKPFPAEVGAVFGELTIREWVNHKRAWHPRCECSCGWIGVIDRHNILRGKSSRCNYCAKRKSGVTQKKYRGYAGIVPDDFHRERLLNRISSCIQRCENPSNAGWKHYGERGIKVHPEWVRDRKAFLSYLLTLDGWDLPHLELDRIDNNAGYQPGNLRFITRSENMFNRRTTETMQNEINRLRAEVARLRRELRGAEEPLHDPD